MRVKHRLPISRVFDCFLLLAVVFGVALRIPPPATAALSSCGVVVSPIEVQPDSSASFNLTFSNTDSSNIKWIRAVKPFDGLTINSTALYKWTKVYVPDGSDIIITDDTGQNPLTPGGQITLELTIGVGSIPGSSGSWTVQASDDVSGSSPITCSGTTALSVTGEAPDTTAPVISGVTISGVSTSQAVISWTTDEVAQSLVKYDVNQNFDTYPFSHSSTSLTTSHSLTLTNSIAANTTYYFKVCSTDASGNQSCTNELQFTTSAASSTPSTTATTVTTTTTTTTTTAASPTPTPSPTPPPVDRTPPRVTITTEFDEPYEQAPLIEGTARDNVLVRNVEYSTDGGDNWLPVDDVESPNTTSTGFSFTPFVFDDGSYDIRVRAKDRRGNIGQSTSQTLVIDRLPPAVGGTLVSMGPMVLVPDMAGNIVSLAGLEQRLFLSTVGGADQILLSFQDLDRESLELTQSVETGLWSTELLFSEPGEYQLVASGKDGAGNTTQRNIDRFVILESGVVSDAETGQPVTEGELTVMSRDPVTNTWFVWDGTAFHQDNPQQLDKDGQYQLYLPAGTYYFSFSAPGYQTALSSIFSLDELTPVDADFSLKPSLNVSSVFESLVFDELPVKISRTVSSEQNYSLQSGDQIPDFLFRNGTELLTDSDIRGQTSIITFISTWSPLALDQIAVFDAVAESENLSIYVVTTQESEARVAVFSERGGYVIPVWADPDGITALDFDVRTLPTHFVLNRRGVIEKRVSGVLNRQELLELLEET